MSSSAEEKPLKLYILDSDNENFHISAVIEGTGTAFDCLSYADFDGDGINEMIIGYKMGSSLQQMAVYSVHDLRPTLLFTSNYSRFTCGDLTADGRADIFILNTASADSAGEATLFSMMEDGEVVSTSAMMSKNIESISKVMLGRLEQNKAAIFVDSAYSTDSSDGTVTDIFAWYDSLKNITLQPSELISSSTERSYAVYCRDIDSDGITEIPKLRALPSRSETVYRVIDWYAFDRSGKSTVKLTTYHNYTDGWYLAFPRSWRNSVSVRRQDNISGERALVFSYEKTDKTVDFLKIYTQSGENREERSELPGRFVLINLGDTIYAAEITQSAADAGIEISREIIQDAFHIIYSDWQS